MEEAYRLIHHLIEWTPSQSSSNVDDAALTLSPSDFFDQDGFNLNPNGSSFIYDIASSYIRETGSRIPKAELDRQIQIIGKTDPNLYGEANAVVAAAAMRGSNGSDIPRIVEAIKNSSKSKRIYAALGKIAQSKEWENPDRAIRTLQETIEDIEQSGNNNSNTITAYNSAENIQHRLELYVDKAKNPDRYNGIKLGWSYFDNRTGGLRGGQTLFVVAGAKTGKSAFCAASIVNAMMIAEADGKRIDVVIANREMKTEWQEDRIEALMMWRHLLMQPKRGLSTDIALSKRIADAKLTPEERVAYKDTLLELSKMKNRLWMIDPDGYKTLDDLCAIIKRMQRDGHPIGVLFIDAMNMQELGKYRKFTDNKVGEQSDLARAVEKMAFELGIPIIAEIQERRETLATRWVDAQDLAANSPAEMPRVACYMLRLFDVPGDPRLIEAQVVAARFCESGWGFPLVFSPGDMIIEEAPMSALQRIDQLCER